MASPLHLFSLLLLLISSSLIAGASAAAAAAASQFNFEDATISEIQAGFANNSLTSRLLTLHYLDRIRNLNPVLKAVLELNPNVLSDADHADRRRQLTQPCGPLCGIPVLLKDNIATLPPLNTTSGSLALLGSVVPREATVTSRLRSAGAIVLGKASMSEWANFRSVNAPDGWNPRGGQGRNSYGMSVGPCGSSSGPAIAVAANLVTVSLGTETDGSIICPGARNSVVGIKPTVGLTSRAGVIPISPRQDTVGTMGRTVADAVAVLDAITGFDSLDAEATEAAAPFIPLDGYHQFLKEEGLKGKRVGILRQFFSIYTQKSVEHNTFDVHFQTMKQLGAILVDDLEIANSSIIMNPSESGEAVVLLAEFKISLNAYLRRLVSTSISSLADVIAFNNNRPIEEKTDEFGQAIFLASQNTSGIGKDEKEAIRRMARLSADGLEKLMNEKQLDVVVFPNAEASAVLAIGGYPAITVPAGYNASGVPFGISFAGLRGSEPELIEVAYGFEQATRVRRPPTIA